MHGDMPNIIVNRQQRTALQLASELCPSSAQHAVHVREGGRDCEQWCVTTCAGRCQSRCSWSSC
jgi:hypothetical protein